ncbi:MAG: glycoside hydrolase family 3 protein [Acidobacteria bacterium]|nr:MAG: glycoside hydrolase family 3 protein [Acidobacteriota bacterium]
MRIGELLILGFRGTTIPAWLRDFEREFSLGGVVLFDRDLHGDTKVRNIESPDQLRSLCDALHRLPSRPLIFVDQEGGVVRRLKPAHGFRHLPSHAELAGLANADALAVVGASFYEMKALGIDFNLAPVVDLNVNPENPNIGRVGRSFSADPNEVRRCAAIMVTAAQQVGLRLCLKHFPGLGGATTDSHTDITDLSEAVSAEQVALFVELCPNLPGNAILLSHGLMKGWDPVRPVSVSPSAVDLLRSAVPDVLLITDDVQMGGLRKLLPTAEACVHAWRAGVDMVCVGNNQVVEEAHMFDIGQALRAAVDADPSLITRCRLAQNRVALRKAA